MCADFIKYVDFINQEFCVFRKLDEYFPLYLVARKGGDTYVLNVEYPQDSLNIKDLNVKIASFKRVNVETLNTDVQSEIVKLINERHTNKEVQNQNFFKSDLYYKRLSDRGQY